MLHKLLKVPKLARPSRRAPPKPPAAAAAAGAPDEDASSVLKIVHAGGNVECYFMPIPAARIVEKYPSFYVTRPEVFRHPWEAVLGPDENLALGEKYYLVPRHTVKKLRRRTRRPSRDEDRSADFGTSRSFHGGDAGARRKDGDSSGSFARRGNDTSDGSTDFFKASRRKSSTAKKHVSFLGIDEKPRKGPPPPPPAPAAAERKHGKVVEKSSKGQKKRSQSSGEKTKVKVTPTWQPALASISEIYGSDD